MPRHRLARAALAATVAVSTLSLGVGPASAATVVQKCATLRGSAAISPGIGNTPADQTMSVRAALKNCAPGAKTGGSGSMRATILLNDATCAKLGSAQTLNGTGRITWANGSVSRIRFQARTSSSDTTLAALTGKVTAGKFDEKLLKTKVRFTPVFTGVGVPCSSTNRLEKLTFTNKINDSTVVPFTIYAP